MWKEALLQGLIALLPVFLFLVWYDRPERTRFVPIFLGFFCGIAMLLSLQYPIVLEQGMQADLRMVPLIVGSFFGGLPVAACLSAVYASFCLSQFTEIWQFVLFFLFLLVFIPSLYRFSSKYQQMSRSKRLRCTLVLWGLAILLSFSEIIAGYGGGPDTSIWGDFRFILVYWGVLTAAVAAGVKFTELGFDRVRLQVELHDMSRKYRMEARRLQQFIDQAPLAVLILDADGKITHINDFCMRWIQPLGRKNVVFEDYRILSHLFPPDSPSPMERVFKGEERVAEMVRFRGTAFYTVTTAVKGTKGPDMEGILFIGHDVTELQQLKDEVGRMERLSLVGQMAASITHEIRNPMAVIRGFVQLLGERSSADQQSYFRIVMEELDRANAIINDFLSLAQNRIVEKQLANLHDVLNELMPLIWADANMRGQIVELRLSEEIEPLELNSKEIKQLVLNLARNAMEAMKDNGVLRIETSNLADTVELRVVDNGVGIPQDQLERLFVPFYTTKSSGTGLGLALCLSIVERHNGKIHVESSVNAGTTFVVSFGKPGKTLPQNAAMYG